MKLQITYTDEFPESLKASAEKCLRDGIAFLESVPRPATPEIEYLTPDFENMQFQFGENVWSHGLFSTDSMKGWCVMDYRSNGDLLINSTPCMTFVNQDPEICTTNSVVFVLDQYFVVGKRPEQHLMRQLQYLDSVAAKNKSIRSLVDDYEQAQKDKEAAEKEAAYKNQFVVKHRLYRQRLKESRYTRTPSWWWSKYPDAVPGDHEAPETTPPPKPQPHYCEHKSPGPQPPAPPHQPAQSPELDEFQKKAVAQQQAMLDYVQQNTITTDSFCTTPEPPTGLVEDNDM